MTYAERLNMTGEQYRKLNAINQSSLKVFADDPEKYRQQYVAKTFMPPEPSAAMLWGLDLESYLFYGKIDAIPIPPEMLSKSGTRRGNAWASFAAEHHDKRLLKQYEYVNLWDSLESAKTNVHAHNVAHEAIFRGDHHVCVQWCDQATQLVCKAQLDIVHPHLLVDLKSAANTRPDAFVRTIEQYRYHWQAAWYREAMCRLTGELLPFLFVVVKNTPSYCVECYELEEDWLDRGWAEIEMQLHRLAQALKDNRWCTATHGEVIRLQQPRWARYSSEYEIGFSEGD